MYINIIKTSRKYLDLMYLCIHYLLPTCTYLAVCLSYLSIYVSICLSVLSIWSFSHLGCGCMCKLPADVYNPRFSYRLTDSSVMRLLFTALPALLKLSAATRVALC